MCVPWTKFDLRRGFRPLSRTGGGSPGSRVRPVAANLRAVRRHRRRLLKSLYRVVQQVLHPCQIGHSKLHTSNFTHRMASLMAAHSPAKPEFVQLTKWGTARVPQGSSWMIFEVDSVAPSCTHPDAWVVHVRDYRYGADPAGMLGRDYQIWSLRPGDYEPV
jgi:hypothetical protein